MLATIAADLSTIHDLQLFWIRLDTTLERMAEVIGASAATLITHRGFGFYHLRSFYGIEKEGLRKRFPESDPYLSAAFSLGAAEVTPVPLELEEGFLAHIRKRMPVELEKLAVLPFDLGGDEKRGCLIFFLHSDLDIVDSPPIEQELQVLAQIVPQFATAYQNSLLYTRLQRIEQRQARELLKLTEASAVVTREESSHEALKTLAQTARQVLGAQSVSIIPYDAIEERADIAAAVTSGFRRPLTLETISAELKDIVDEVITRGHLQVDDVRDLAQYPFLSEKYLAYAERVEVRSLVAQVAGTAERPMGIILASARNPSGFSDDSVRTFGRFANQAALALRIATEQRAKDRYIRELDLISKIGDSVSLRATERLHSLLADIHQKVDALLDARNFYVAFYDSRTSLVEFPYAVEGGKAVAADDAAYGARHAGNGLTEFLIRTGKPLLIPADCESWCRRNEVDLVGRMALSWLGAPMISEGEILGIMAVQNFEGEYAYDEHDERLLTLVASQAAAATKINRLFEELRQAKEQVERLAKASLENTPVAFTAELFHDRVVHDLKNVVAATVQTLDDLNESSSFKRLSHTQQRALGTLSKRVKQSVVTLESFLKVGKTASGEGAARANLEGIIKQVVNIQQMTLESKNIQVEIRFAESVPELRLPSIQVLMVLFNLVTNAIAALEQVDRRRILALETKISKDGKWVELSVTDNGIGMRKKLQESLFDPYVSGDSRRGTGLGLFGSLQLVRRVGGSIVVSSRYGKGSTFVVRFPRSIAG